MTKSTTAGLAVATALVATQIAVVIYTNKKMTKVTDGVKEAVTHPAEAVKNAFKKTSPKK